MRFTLTLIIRSVCGSACPSPLVIFASFGDLRVVGGRAGGRRSRRWRRFHGPEGVPRIEVGRVEASGQVGVRANATQIAEVELAAGRAGHDQRPDSTAGLRLGCSDRCSLQLTDRCQGAPGGRCCPRSAAGPPTRYATRPRARPLPPSSRSTTRYRTPEKCSSVWVFCDFSTRILPARGHFSLSRHAQPKITADAGGLLHLEATAVQDGKRGDGGTSLRPSCSTYASHKLSSRPACAALR